MNKPIIVSGFRCICGAINPIIIDDILNKILSVGSVLSVRKEEEKEYIWAIVPTKYGKIFVNGNEWEPLPIFRK